MGIAIDTVKGFSELAGVAEATKTWFIIRGSVARSFAQIVTDYDNLDPVHSIFDLIEPLGELDVICPVETWGSVRRMASSVLSELNFFNLRFRSLDTFPSGTLHRTNLIVLAEPLLAFLPRESKCRDLPVQIKPTFVFRQTLSGGLKMLSPSKKPPCTKLKWIGESDENFLPAAALRDFVYVARLDSSASVSHKEELAAQISSYLLRTGGERIAREFRDDPDELERTKLALLRYILDPSSDPDGERVKLLNVLNYKFFKELDNAIRDPMFSELYHLLRLTADNVRAVVGPHQGRGDQLILNLFSSSVDEEKEKKEYVSSESDIEKALQDGYLSPVFTVSLTETADRSCCRYKDFSQGILTIVWADSQIEKRRSKFTFAFAKFDLYQDIYFAHAHISLGRISSVRFDKGFIESIAGSSPYVRVAAPWVESMEGEL